MKIPSINGDMNDLRKIPGFDSLGDYTKESLGKYLATGKNPLDDDPVKMIKDLQSDTKIPAKQREMLEKAMNDSGVQDGIRRFARMTQGYANTDKSKAISDAIRFGTQAFNLK